MTFTTAFATVLHGLTLLCLPFRSQVCQLFIFTNYNNCSQGYFCCTRPRIKLASTQAEYRGDNYITKHIYSFRHTTIVSSRWNYCTLNLANGCFPWENPGSRFNIKIPSYKYSDSITRIRRSSDRIIFIMEILIPGKTVFNSEKGLGYYNINQRLLIPSIWLFLGPQCIICRIQFETFFETLHKGVIWGYCAHYALDLPLGSLIYHVRWPTIYTGMTVY